ncbi:dihydrofolate reductase [Deinobacterium chartae]|uniref:Dihydrofolate reductase n=1 Tax=Deinobacterium chartae TaxID=521158 RepID=A0A841HXE1_9DEIO|nr:dihydrofolate reductase family protein [Deinobacterium chartae]MBB6096632.1 dihydrofolate reductase [Deinobacterium chartae]
MRKLVYYVAISLDGFISRADGRFDFFPDDDPQYFSAYADSLREFDTVLMGRHTFEVGTRAGVTNPYVPYGPGQLYVFSRTHPDVEDPAVQMVRENAGAFVRELKAREGRNLYLCGGAELATALFDENLIDEVIVKLNPVMVGQGKSLLTRAFGSIRLKLTETRIFESGVMFLRYRVTPTTPTPI